MKKIVAVDFDGVLYNSLAGSGLRANQEIEPNDGCRTFFEALKEKGFDVIIISSRAMSREGRQGIIDWLINKDLMKFTIDVTHIKVGAVAYVDNRAVRYNEELGDDWEDVLDAVVNLAARRG